VTISGTPIASAPLVWAELISGDVQRASAFYGAMLGWKPASEPGTTDLVVYLDQARAAGPICGIRPRTPSDPRPEGVDGPVPDRWTVRLSPPRPPRAADPASDQLLRPRAPGPRLGRWASPQALCYAELRTQDVDGARLWMERRLDAAIEPVDPAAEPGLGTMLVQSSVNPSAAVLAIVDESDPAEVGWYPCVQVASLERSIGLADQAGVGEVRERPVPAGCPGAGALEVTDPGGGRIVLIEHGPAHGRR
jgi:catechol 2,3-dioxygenase-like lactoylglutathione lyase family enzyme